MVIDMHLAAVTYQIRRAQAPVIEFQFANQLCDHNEGQMEPDGFRRVPMGSRGMPMFFCWLSCPRLN